jgi:hypothetical protein
VMDAEKQGHDKLMRWVNAWALDIVLKRVSKEMDSLRVFQMSIKDLTPEFLMEFKLQLAIMEVLEQHSPVHIRSWPILRVMAHSNWNSLGAWMPQVLKSICRNALMMMSHSFVLICLTKSFGKSLSLSRLAPDITTWRRSGKEAIGWLSWVLNLKWLCICLCWWRRVDERTKTWGEKNQKRVIWSEMDCKESSKCIKSELDV